MESVALKRCSTCHELLPRTEFHTRQRSRDGLQANCKDCAQEATRRWWEKRGREAQRTYHQEWRVANPEASRAASRRHYQAHRADEIQRVVTWRRENAAWVKQYDTLWRQVNRKNSEYRRRRTARQRGAVRIPFTVAQLIAKLTYWGNRCWICDGAPNAVDHVKPLAKGGPHCLANLRPICTSCNSKKRSKWPYPSPKE